jgi:hypothetical protein
MDMAMAALSIVAATADLRAIRADWNTGHFFAFRRAGVHPLRRNGLGRVAPREGDAL